MLFFQCHPEGLQRHLFHDKIIVGTSVTTIVGLISVEAELVLGIICTD